MGGGEQGRFGCVRGILFVDETTVVHDEYAVTDELNLGKLTGIEQDRRAAGRQLAQQGVNLVLGLDIDAPGGVKAEQGTKAGHEPAANRDFLLVPAGKPPHLGCRPGIDRKAVDCVHYALAFIGWEAQPLPDAAEKGNNQVLAHGKIGQKG